MKNLIIIILLNSISASYSQEVICNIRVMPKNDLPISDRQKIQKLQKSAENLLITESGPMKFLKMKLEKH